MGESEIKLPGLVMSPEILKPEFQMRTLNPITFEFGEFCYVSDFLSNPDCFPPALFWVCGRTKMADLVMESMELHSLVALFCYRSHSFIMGI